MVGMNAVFALIAYPAGRLADRLGPEGVTYLEASVTPGNGAST